MRTLYPLKFSPILKEKVWGGIELKRLLGKEIEHLPNCGESWELSGIPGSESTVRNGFLAGNRLTELIEVYMGDLVGDHVFEKHGTSFPLLFKFIDTADDLSIQVHPDDRMAFEKHQSQGKAELWYVLDADPGAELILGLQEDSSPEEFRRQLENKTLRSLLKSYKVQKGDVFYIPTGQVHAIGRGIRLCEIQQASDITYRVYDWDRPGIDGKPRKLHIEEGLQAIDYAARDNKVEYQMQYNEPVELIKAPKFTIRALSFDKELKQDYLFVDSFVVYMCLEGSFVITYQGGYETVKAGETVLIPAEINNIGLRPDVKSLVLETYVT